MLSFILLVAAFVCANAAVLPQVKIVGGTLTTISEAPWQVALLYDSSNSGTFSQICGGTIITRYCILSAAQCTYETLSSQWRIRAGSSFHNTGGQVIQVSSIYELEGYNNVNLANDLVILRLSRQITLGSSAATVTLPAQGLSVVDGAMGIVTGWGRLYAGGVVPSQLLMVSVPIFNQADCVSAYTGYNPVTSSMICAGYSGEVGGPCQGDTGGPLVINKILIGVTSWSRGCGEKLYPGVYTRVPMFNNWITANTADFQ